MRKRRKKHSMTYDSTKYVHGRTNGSTVRRKTGKGVCFWTKRNSHNVFCAIRWKNNCCLQWQQHVNNMTSNFRTHICTYSLISTTNCFFTFIYYLRFLFYFVALGIDNESMDCRIESTDRWLLRIILKPWKGCQIWW